MWTMATPTSQSLANCSMSGLQPWRIESAVANSGLGSRVGPVTTRSIDAVVRRYLRHARDCWRDPRGGASLEGSRRQTTRCQPLFRLKFRGVPFGVDSRCWGLQREESLQRVSTRVAENLHPASFSCSFCGQDCRLWSNSFEVSRLVRTVHHLEVDVVARQFAEELFGQPVDHRLPRFAAASAVLRLNAQNRVEHVPCHVALISTETRIMS